MFIKILTLLFITSAQAQVLTTLPEFAWIVSEMGVKDKVTHLLSGNEDPHFVDASPAFVFKMAKAKLLIKNGMQLEVGWLPKVTEQSGNELVQLGGKGFCDASSDIKKLGVIENYDRSMGDVHPVGNPHYTLSLIEMKTVIGTIARCLERAGVSFEQKKKELLENRFTALFKKLDSKLKQFRNTKLMVYHTEFNYLFKDFRLKSVGSLEEVPGVLPSALYMSKSANLAKKNMVSLVLASHVSPEKYLEKFKGLSKIDYIKAQIHPLNEDDYLLHYEKFINELIGKLNASL